MLLVLSALLLSLRGCVAQNGSTETPSTTVGGQQVSPTGTAKGLCSGSHPNIVCACTLSALCVLDISFNISVTNTRTVNVTCNISFPVAVTDSNLAEKLLQVVRDPQVIAAFVAGILFSAPFYCLCRKCHRKKRKSSEYMVERLEMVTTQSAQNDGCRDGEAAEGGARSAGQPPREVEYSDIDFSRWNRTTGTTDAPKATDTEYAEIHKEKKEDGPEKEGEYSEILERNEEVLPLMEEAEETNPCLFVQKEEVEEVAGYSGVN